MKHHGERTNQDVSAKKSPLKIHADKLLIFLMLLSFVFGCQPSPGQKEVGYEVLSNSKPPKIIMAIFAHPDVL